VSASSAFEHGYALLAGVGQDLPCTALDAAALADLLKDPARAAYPPEQVALLTEAQATRRNILDVLKSLAKKTLADPEATVIVYYSGHGARIGSSADLSTCYLLAHGHDIARPAETCISDREFSDAILGLHAKKLLVLLDCCHAAGIPLAKGAAERVTPALPPEALARLSAGEGRVVLASCRDDERSFTGSPHSVFTTCLLEALMGLAPAHLGFARVLEVVCYVMREVPLREPRQHPFLCRAESLSESFPICRSAPPRAEPQGGAKSASAPDWKRQATRRKIQSYIPAYELRLKKLEALRLAHTITADASLRFQYEQQIQAAEAEVQKDEATLEKLHLDLGEP
jgi:hypothetical protein